MTTEILSIFLQDLTEQQAKVTLENYVLTVTWPDNAYVTYDFNGYISESGLAKFYHYMHKQLAKQEIKRKVDRS